VVLQEMGRSLTAYQDLEALQGTAVKAPVQVGPCRRFRGILDSFHLSFASGPTIILTAALIYGVSLRAAPGGLLQRNSYGLQTAG
jgi:zinc/manganese transport system permease protein